MHHDSLWRILQYSYQLPEKFLTIVQALHQNSTADKKTDEKFPVIRGDCQRCVLGPTLFNLYFDVAIGMAGLGPSPTGGETL